jgi:hypothetical protein
MIRNLLILATASFLTISSCAQITTPSTTPTTPSGTTSSGNSSSVKNKINTSAPATSSPSQQGSGVFGQGNDQLINGLKEALSLSATNSSAILSAADGYFKNPLIKIPMPPDAKIVETKLRSLGMGDEVDKMILSMNRAAESAAKDAAPIFIDAIKSMSFTDAMGIVQGSNDAATQYLKKTTSAQLTAKFHPVIQAALDKVDATKYWSDIVSTYNKIPFVKPVNSDLNAYVTQKALDGLFLTMAEQEAKIRKDPAATANELIKSVFGKH